MKKRNKILKIFLMLMLMTLTSCAYQEDEGLPTLSDDRFKLKLKKIKHNFMLVWPAKVNELPLSEDSKLKSLVNILDKANDVEVEIIPIYHENMVNKDLIGKRSFGMREIIYRFGIPFNKIHIRHTFKPKKYEEGFLINLTVYELKVPNCSKFKDTGIKSLEESFKSFKCSTVANFGKLIAFPSSLSKYKRTDNDRVTALKSLSERGGE